MAKKNSKDSPEDSRNLSSAAKKIKAVGGGRENASQRRMDKEPDHKVEALKKGASTASTVKAASQPKKRPHSKPDTARSEREEAASQMVQVGDQAPDFSLPNQEGEEVSLGDLATGDQWLVLFFFPQASTPQSTKEAVEFSKRYLTFLKDNTEVYGISPDSQGNHKRFKSQRHLKINLLADKDQKVCQEYGVWQVERVYGRNCMEVITSTFLIDSKGKIAYRWPKISDVENHPQEVLEKVRELRK